jgi:hypothetical protein
VSSGAPLTSNVRTSVRMVESWYDAQQKAAAAPTAAPAAAGDMVVYGQGVDLSLSAVQGRLAASKASQDPRLAGWGTFKALANEGLYRVMSPELGPDSQGPPFTDATGIGWDTSTEPKNKADMQALAMKLNPVVGFWGAHRTRTEFFFQQRAAQQCTRSPRHGCRRLPRT